ncbi:MAG: hypothetical protein ABWY93_18635 [Mycobacterium sp.]
MENYLVEAVLSRTSGLPIDPADAAQIICQQLFFSVADALHEQSLPG